MSQAYDRYLETKTAYEQATERVERQVAQLGKFVTPLLFNWKRYYVDANVPTPADMKQERIRVSGQGIPSPSEIAQTMIAQFEALQRAMEAWSRIPEPERGELRKPPWLPEQDVTAEDQRQRAARVARTARSRALRPSAP